MLTETELKCFNCISNFVEDLNSTFERCKTINLYNKLISKTTFRDEPAVKRHIDAFISFYIANPNFVNNRTITDNPKVSYSDRIYIDISWVLHRSRNDKSTNDAIYSHLVAIYTVLNAEKKEVLELYRNAKESKIVANNSLTDSLAIPDTIEGEFIKDTFDGIGELAKEIDLDANANPGEMIGAVMNSDFFKNFAGNMQSKFQKGEINPQALLQTVGGIVSESGMGGELGSMLGGMGMAGIGGEQTGDISSVLSAMNIDTTNNNN
jgi:hypothetical protein